jgi:hypothetical protein
VTFTLDTAVAAAPALDVPFAELTADYWLLGG